MHSTYNYVVYMCTSISIVLHLALISQKKNSSFWLSLISNPEKFEYIFVLGEGGLSIGTCAQSHYDLCICTIKMCSNQVMYVINHNRIHLPRQYMLDHDIDMKKYPLM